MPIYMWYEGIDGPVKRKGKKWIELQSAQVGVNRQLHTPVGAVSREASTPSVTEIVVTKYLDDTSTALFREALVGDRGKKVVLEFVQLDKNGAEEAAYLTVELENTMVSSYSTSGAGGDSHGRPMESLSLNFVKMTFATTAPGKVTDRKTRVERSAWDLAEARGS